MLDAPPRADELSAVPQTEGMQFPSTTDFEGGGLGGMDTERAAWLPIGFFLFLWVRASSLLWRLSSMGRALATFAVAMFIGFSHPPSANLVCVPSWGGHADSLVCMYWGDRARCVPARARA